MGQITRKKAEELYGRLCEKYKNVKDENGQDEVGSAEIEYVWSGVDKSQNLLYDEYCVERDGDVIGAIMAMDKTSLERLQNEVESKEINI